MSEYVAYLDGGKTNAEGHNKFLNRFFTAGVPTSYSATSLQVTQRGAGANMSVDVAVGDVHLNMPTNAYSLWGYTDAVKNVTVAAADATNPRIDTIVVYGDVTAFSATNSNNPGALKFISVAGTPAATPVAATAAAIQTAIGGSNIPYQVLATVAVAANTATITTANITDARTGIATRILPSVGASQAWVPTVVGWGSATATQYRYFQIGKQVTLFIYVNGVSNNSTTTISLPVPPATTMSYYEGQLGLAIDNGVATGPGRWSIDNVATSPNAATVVNFFANQGGGSFTASGSKQVRAVITYEAQ